MSAASGQQAKEEQLTLLRERRGIYIRRGQRALLMHLLQHDRGTADEVYGSVDLPDEIDPRCLGAVPGTASR